MKIKVGDIVKLKNQRGRSWNQNGKMDRYLGREVEIIKIMNNSFNIKQDEGHKRYTWMFQIEDIEKTAGNKFAPEWLVFN